MTNVRNDFVAEILKENTRLKKEVEKLRAKLESRKQKGLDFRIKNERKERMRATWEPGGINYHKSKVYKGMTLPELAEYHTKYGDEPCGESWSMHLKHESEKNQKKSPARAKKQTSKQAD